MPNPTDPPCDKFDGWVTPANFRVGHMAYAKPFFGGACPDGFVVLVSGWSVKDHDLKLVLGEMEDGEIWVAHLDHPKLEISWHYHRKEE